MAAPLRVVSSSQRESLLQAERERLVHDERLFSRHPRTISNYDRMNKEFTDYLCHMFADPDEGWASCRPDDVCLFLHEYLLPQLTGRATTCVASTTLQGYTSALSRCFTLRGRTREWCDDTGTGNPVRSELVNTALRVYQQKQLRQGERVRSAVPMEVDHVQQLAQAMDSAIVSAALQRLHRRVSILLRDLTHMLCMWAGGRRGQDVLQYNWEDFYFVPNIGAAVPIATAWRADIPHADAVPPVLYVTPSRTKTEYLRRPHTQALPSNADPALCAVRRLRLFYQWQRAVEGCEPRGPVFLTTGSSPARMSSQAALQRIRSNIIKYGTDRGETMHSFRRGCIQAAQARGEPSMVTMQHVGIQTVKTFRRYTDPCGHV